jgi:hypothetical protein
MEPGQAAAKIQNRVRIGLAKAKVESKKEDFAAAQKKLGMLVHWAVVTIQRNFRGRWGRRRFQQHMLLKQVWIFARSLSCYYIRVAHIYFVFNALP